MFGFLRRNLHTCVLLQSTWRKCSRLHRGCRLDHRGFLILLSGATKKIRGRMVEEVRMLMRRGNSCMVSVDELVVLDALLVSGVGQEWVGVFVESGTRQQDYHTEIHVLSVVVRVPLLELRLCWKQK